MKKEIILESKFTAHQKTHILVVLGIPVVIMTMFVLSRHYNNSSVSTSDLGKLIFLGFVFLIVGLIIFFKNGVLKKDDGLYLGTYIFGKLLFKKEIDLTNISKLAILKLRKSQKMAWYSLANPDQALSYDRNDVTLLNDKHTQKTLLISLEDENLANETVSFLEENFDLTLETYSPDFS
ncbi:hypothetical protein [Tenacibaculum sp. 190524A05c]|uniref:hypothetical protein n=1 Tax=Tenacibaculum platacis TaxID=3137852 RepID=UPI0031FB6223